MVPLYDRFQEQRECCQKRLVCLTLFRYMDLICPKHTSLTIDVFNFSIKVLPTVFHKFSENIVERIACLFSCPGYLNLPQ